MAKLEEALYKVYCDVSYGMVRSSDHQESIVKNMESNGAMTAKQKKQPNN